MAQRGKKLDEALKNTIECMLLSGKVGCEIACDLDVSLATIGKIRKELKKRGKDYLWHNQYPGLISRGIGV